MLVATQESCTWCTGVVHDAFINMYVCMCVCARAPRGDALVNLKEELDARATDPLERLLLGLKGEGGEKRGIAGGAVSDGR